MAFRYKFVLFLLALSPFFLRAIPGDYYVPGPDEAFQIQGARELAAGRGYFSARESEPGDLAAPKLRYVTFWPVGYSALLAGPIALGLSPGEAAKLVWLFSFLAGVFGWCLLLRQLRLAPLMEALFLGFLGVQYLAWAVYVTSSLTWALVPLLVYGLLGRKLWVAVVATALLLLLRYQNLYLFAGTALFLLCARRWRDFLVYLPVPALVYGLVSWTNARFGGSSTFLKEFEQSWFWQWEWPLSGPIAALLGGGFRLDEWVGGLLHRGVAGMVAYWATGLFCLAILLFVAFIAWKSRRSTDARAHFLLWAALTTFTLLGLLLALSVRLGLDFLAHARYYYAVAPMVVLAILLKLEHGLPASWLRNRRLVTVMALLGLVGVAAVAYVYGGHRARLARGMEARLALARGLIAEFRKGTAEPGFVVLDHLMGAWAVHEDGPFFDQTRVLVSPAPRVSRPTWLFVVQETRPEKLQYSPLEKVGAIAERLGLMHKESDGLVVYGKILLPDGH